MEDDNLDKRQINWFNTQSLRERVKYIHLLLLRIPYLVSPAISHHHKHSAVLQGDSILDLDANPVVYLFADCRHRHQINHLHNNINTKTQTSATLGDINDAVTLTTCCQQRHGEGLSKVNLQPKQA